MVDIRAFMFWERRADWYADCIDATPILGRWRGLVFGIDVDEFEEMNEEGGGEATGENPYIFIMSRSSISNWLIICLNNIRKSKYK